jgi:two-component system, NtrC family, sensor kinase
MTETGSAALSAIKEELANGGYDAAGTARVLALVAGALAEQRQFMGKIVDTLPVGLYVVDREYRVQTWNRGREIGLQGVSRDDAIGKTIFEILHRQPAETLRREFDTVFETGELQQFDTESLASGDPRTYRISKIPMRLGDGPVTHVITVGEDVTEWKGAQQRAAHSEKMAAIGQLAAGVMHEINNPLATISACAESVAVQLADLGATGVAVPPDCTEYMRYIDAEVHRCKGIIDGLLDFSRARPVAKEPLDLNDVIDRTLFLVGHHERVKRLAVETDLTPMAGAAVIGNSDRLIQVFMALVLNAADAMANRPGGGSIVLRTVRDDGQMVIAEVTDNGVGIPRTVIPKIFEPFYTTKPPGRGTGLGLSICYGIVADHGGRMEVESTVGVGSTFRIILPVGPL